MQKVLSLWVLLFPFVAFGCNTSSFRVEEVSGVVTLDGRPIEGATLTFAPVQAHVGKSAYARTAADGSYRLTAVQAGEVGAGTMVGRYRVAVTLEKPSREPTEKERAAVEQGLPLDIPNISVVPIKYNDAATSGLDAEVVRGKNRFDFPLTSK